MYSIDIMLFATILFVYIYLFITHEYHPCTFALLQFACQPDNHNWIQQCWAIVITVLSLNPSPPRFGPGTSSGFLYPYQILPAMATNPVIYAARKRGCRRMPQCLLAHAGQPYPARYTPEIRRLYSPRAASSRSLAVVSPGTLWDGWM